MTTTDPNRPSGYRGALPTREDRLARPWIFLIIGFFVLILVLSILAVPSRFIPDPTPVPLPSVSASTSVEPSASVPPSSSASASVAPSASASVAASASAEPSPTATSE